MSTPYIGPERRKAERRAANPTSDGRGTVTVRVRQPERRVIERRQEALAGVIANMTAEDMLALAELWKKREAIDEDALRAADQAMLGHEVGSEAHRLAALEIGISAYHAKR